MPTPITAGQLMQIRQRAKDYPATMFRAETVESLAEEIYRLNRVIREVLEIHADAGESQGYTETGYGDIAHVCGECGTPGEYGIEWPCETYRLLAAALRD